MVSNEEISEMKRLQSILDGNFTVEKTKLTEHTSSTSTALSSTPNKADIKEMGRLLTIMEGEMPVILEKAQTDNILREALVTKEIDNGIKIGTWKIEKVIETGITQKKETYYRLTSPETFQYIKEQIFLHEAAMGVTRYLNNGYTPNHNTIIKAIGLDQEYQRLRTKALEEKYCWHRVQGTDREWKQELYEAKFDVAKNKALFIKEQIKNLLNI